MTEKTYGEKLEIAKLAFEDIFLGIKLAEKDLDVEILKFWDRMIEVDGTIFDLKDYNEQL